MTRWGKSSFANRGMAFEQLLDYTNRLYENQGVAVINKRPTPVKILGRNTRGMVNGYLEKPSTVDYDGTYAGRSLCLKRRARRSSRGFHWTTCMSIRWSTLQSVIDAVPSVFCWSSFRSIKPCI